MKLVLVEWLDAHSRSDAGWKKLDDVMQDSKPLPVKSVGYLVSQSKAAVVLVPHISGDGERVAHFCCGELSVPRRNIVKMTVLRK